ncbi:type 1 glutamine amidotransferase [Actinoplanes sp. ATCC 53533]|uniref:type 1 glutamine amidotransferase n=1 Tax=Actinoplanes sp. ATCC 53533 TaxID=1288362 RepID=UPI001F3D84B0|nr:type 1 glutamine amidotransferase [Actinoplanes sp. ATCC 53533]
MSLRLLVIQHDHASPLGPVAERFAERGYDATSHLVVPAARFHDPGVETEFPDFTRFDAVVLMGAPWSAYDELVASWVVPERDRLRGADEAGVPVLGICFGGQLLASTLGGAVGPSAHPEIGWTHVASDDEAIVPSGRWFQWHYDRWRVPPGAREIARNAAASQAFVLRRNLAVQFHPELTSGMLAGWLGNGGAAKAAAGGVDVPELVAATRAGEAAARTRARLLVDGFLDVVATGVLGPEC